MEPARDSVAFTRRGRRRHAAEHFSDLHRAVARQPYAASSSGTGDLAIAALIFANWPLGRMRLACLLLGAATALHFFLPSVGVEVPSAC